MRWNYWCNYLHIIWQGAHAGKGTAGKILFKDSLCQFVFPVPGWNGLYVLYDRKIQLGSAYCLLYSHFYSCFDPLSSG